MPHQPLHFSKNYHSCQTSMHATVWAIKAGVIEFDYGGSTEARKLKEASLSGSRKYRSWHIYDIVTQFFANLASYPRRSLLLHATLRHPPWLRSPVMASAASPVSTRLNGPYKDCSRCSLALYEVTSFKHDSSKICATVADPLDAYWHSSVWTSRGSTISRGNTIQWSRRQW